MMMIMKKMLLQIKAVMMMIIIMETMVILVYIHEDGRFQCLWRLTTLRTSSRTQWALAPNFFSQATRKSQFFLSEKAYAGHPGFHRFRALGPLQFLLE